MKELSFNPISNVCVSNHGCSRYSMLMYNKKHNIIWSEVPRCASTSLRFLFKRNGFNEVETRVPLPRYIITQNPKVIVFIRNPEKRLVSSYNHYKRHEGSYYDILDRNTSFQDFVCKLKTNKMDHHWMPFVNFFPNRDPDFIGNINLIKQSLELINEKFGMNINTESLEHMNPRRIHENKTSFKDISDEAKEHFRKLFKEDISIWNNLKIK